MKVIDSQTAEILSLGEATLEEGKKIVEIAGRTCYKSLNLITEGSAEKFVFRMISSEHLSTLEPQPNGFLKSNKNPALPVRSRLNPSKDRVGKTASRFQAPFVRKAREVCCPPQEKESRSKRVGFILSAD